MWRYLTRRHKRRRPRRARPSRDTIKDRASIHNRPKTIESRGEAGHWEGDLIICKRTRPVLVCMSVSHGSRSPRGSQGRPPQRPSQRCSRCSAASILICGDQSLSATTPPSPTTACSGCRFPVIFDSAFPRELTRLDDGFGVRRWSSSEISPMRVWRLSPSRLNRKLSFPVSRMWQRWARRSSSAVVILASPNTVAHSPKLRLVVMMTLVRS